MRKYYIFLLAKIALVTLLIESWIHFVIGMACYRIVRRKKGKRLRVKIRN